VVGPNRGVTVGLNNVVWSCVMTLVNWLVGVGGGLGGGA
jgi:hypothetical protein